MFLTILTPTYNRKSTLPKLYESLIKQSNKNFIWYVVDDGSKDNTEELIKEYQNKNDIKIIYEYKENGGKHKALNFALRKIKTELTFIVDSDDWLTEDAVSIINEYYNKYRDEKDLCGFSFLRKYPDGKINDKLFPKDELKGNYIDVRINGNIGGDKAEIFYTKCLKEYPFVEFENENFLGEDIVWIDMALKYQMIHINKAIYVGNYLESGLTNNRRENNINAPKGCVERAKRLMYKQCNLKTRVKGILSYIAYSKFDNKNYKEIIRNCKNKFIVTTFYPFGYLIYLKWRKTTKSTKF